MNGNQNYSYYNPYQFYIKKKVNPKKGVSTFQQPYPYTELSDSNTISNISALNNNNTSSNFLDLTDTIEIKGLSDVKSKREKEKLSKQSEDKSGQRTNGRNRFYDKNELLNANGSNEYLLKRNQNNNPPQNIISKNIGTFSFKNLFNPNKEKNLGYLYHDPYIRKTIKSIDNFRTKVNNGGIDKIFIIRIEE